jgi:hypothetical protein
MTSRFQVSLDRIVRFYGYFMISLQIFRICVPLNVKRTQVFRCVLFCERIVCGDLYLSVEVLYCINWKIVGCSNARYDFHPFLVPRRHRKVKLFV